MRALLASDLVYAGYSLPYIHPDDLARVWGLVRTSLRPGAWFAGNLFGVRDSWAGPKHWHVFDVITRQRRAPS